MSDNSKPSTPAAPRRKGGIRDMTAEIERLYKEIVTMDKLRLQEIETREKNVNLQTLLHAAQEENQALKEQLSETTSQFQSLQEDWKHGEENSASDACQGKTWHAMMQLVHRFGEEQRCAFQTPAELCEYLEERRLVDVQFATESSMFLCTLDPENQRLADLCESARKAQFAPRFDLEEDAEILRFVVEATKKYETPIPK